MNKFVALTLIALMLFSCSSGDLPINPEVYEYDTLRISFKKPIKEGAWLVIDEVKYSHSKIDTLQSRADKQVFLDKIGSSGVRVIPTSENYVQLKGENKWFREDFSNYEMAMALLHEIGKVEEERTLRGEERRYELVGSNFLLYEGKITLKRLDGKPIKVQKSDLYGAVIGSN